MNFQFGFIKCQRAAPELCLVFAQLKYYLISYHVFLAWVFDQNLSCCVPSAHRSSSLGCKTKVLGASCHPPCPLCWWQSPGADWTRGRPSRRDQDPGDAGAPRLRRAPRAPAQGQGTRDSHLFISKAGSESQRSGNPSVLPATAEPNQAPNAPAPACSAPLPPRLCWHGPANEAGLIGSCVCGQGVMKRFSVSLCKLP